MRGSDPGSIAKNVQIAQSVAAPVFLQKDSCTRGVTFIFQGKEVSGSGFSGGDWAVLLEIALFVVVLRMHFPRPEWEVDREQKVLLHYSFFLFFLSRF